MYVDFETEKSVILLADDHTDILDFIADDLEDKYEIIKALNGREALEYVYVGDIDLIVSDIMMPQINGYEFCTRIKENDKYNHIPFIMLTAKNSLQSKIEGLEYGADAYIEKPFSPKFLKAQISSLLRNRKHVKDYLERMPTSPFDINGHNKSDQAFIKKLNKLILENIANPELSVAMLSERLFMSRPTLYRKIKTLSNMSPNELINQTRLNKATQLLVEGTLKIYEIADMIGFNTASHFSHNFQKHFGISPKDYVTKFKQGKA